MGVHNQRSSAGGMHFVEVHPLPAPYTHRLTRHELHDFLCFIERAIRALPTYSSKMAPMIGLFLLSGFDRTEFLSDDILWKHAAIPIR